MRDAAQSIHQYYAEAFRAMDTKRSAPPIEVTYYPYVGINHTIRIRSGMVFVRIGEICRKMPASGHRALAQILVAKLLRKMVPAEAQRVYSAYIKSPEVRQRALERKRELGRKVITTAAGDVYNLDRIFDRLNKKYFRGRLPRPVLTWSSRKTFRILGHHDATHQTVVVSKSLDSANVPRYVVEYVVFHEMLHVFHPTQHVNGRRYNHTPAFRHDEQKFLHFEEAELWIEKNVRKLKRAARKS
ncbi:MAG: SprT-like domain-containing protein [Acidobacteriota bacterium]